MPSAQSLSATAVAATMRSSASRASSGSSHPGRGFDQLDRRPDGDEQLRRVVARVLGRGQRLPIAAEAVEENRVRPVRVLDRGSLASGGGLLDRGVDQARKPRPRAPESRRARARRTARPGLPVASVTPSASATSSAALPNSPPSTTAWRQHVDADREHGQGPESRASSTPRVGDREAGLVVPDHHRRRGREPPPAEHLLDRDVVARKAGRGLLEHRRRRGAAFGESQREAVQQQIGRTRTVRPGRGAATRLARDVVQARPRSRARPANSAELHASRYVSRASCGSSGSSVFAARRSSAGASLPRLSEYAASARSRSRRAR